MGSGKKGTLIAKLLASNAMKPTLIPRYYFEYCVYGVLLKSREGRLMAVVSTQ